MKNEQPSLGVSAIVRLIGQEQKRVSGRMLSTEDGAMGMIIDQRPNSSHRYAVMIPGDPIAGWYQPDELELVQGIDLDAWWRR